MDTAVNVTASIPNKYSRICLSFLIILKYSTGKCLCQVNLSLPSLLSPTPMIPDLYRKRERKGDYQRHLEHSSAVF